MNRIMIACAIVGMAGVVFAKQTGEEALNGLPAADREKILRLTGGYIEKKGSAKGRIVILNKQERVTTNELAAVFAAFRQDVDYNFELVAGDGKPGDVTIEVLDDPTKPVLLAAPFDYWAQVNVARMSDGLKTDGAFRKFMPSRTRKLILKAFAFACGVGCSQYPQNVMSVQKVTDVDYVEERLPFDTIKAIELNLSSRGVTPRKFVTYRKACAEGWAPAPTNDVQKAIWDKVHQMPTEPLKIKPETKKVRD